MESAVIKIICYLLIIALGFTLKRARLFKSGHSEILSKIILNITLPAVIITSLQNISFSGRLAFALAIGICYNLLMLGLGAVISRRACGKSEEIMYRLFIPSQNVGVFGIPIVQACFPTSVLASVFLFDMGNSIVLFGPSFILASVRANGTRVTPKVVIKKLLSTPTFDAYSVVLILSLLNLKLPDPVKTFAGICGAGNGFLAMLLFGIMLEPVLEKHDFQLVFRIIAVRIVAGAIAAILIWYLLPIQPELRAGIIFCLAMPTTTASAAYALTLNCDKKQISGLSTISLIISAALALLLAALLV